MDLSSLSNITNAATALSNLILVSPQKTIGYQPQSPPSKNGQQQQQPPSILFHYEGEQTALLESDITDHFVEDNTAIQDQIALKPEIITTHGFIGELNNVTPRSLELVKELADKLTVIDAYTPTLSETALLAYNEAFFLYQNAINVKNAAVAAWSSINGDGGEAVIGASGIVSAPQNQTKQQIAFQQFYGYWRNRTLFTVQTPWAVFQNVAIKTLRAIQDAETRMITDFEVAFKMIRFSTTQTTPPPVFAGRGAAQAGGVTDQGTQTPPESSVDFGASIQAIA